MLTIQNIIMAILKAPHIDILSNVCTVREKEFMTKLNASDHVKNLTVDKMLNGKPVLIWDSPSGVAVACHIHETGFFFSSAAFYRKKAKEMMPASVTHFYGDKERRFMEEGIAEIKNLFISYSHDAGLYFK